MFSRLTALVGGGSALPFELGEEFPAASSFCGWQHFRGTSKADSAPVSVFRIAAPKGDARLDAARNGAKRLRTMRHPNVLVFKELVEQEERNEVVIYIMTEAVTPLVEVLRGMGSTDRQQYLCMGLGSIVSALAFLSNDCSLIHGAVCMAAVVVTQSLDWKLHGFDLMSEHQFASQYDLPLTAASWLLPQQYKAGEVAKSDWQAVKDGPAWGVDAWGLGCLMQEVYSGTPLARTEDLRSTERVPKDLLQFYQRLLASQPARRLNPKQLLEAGVLRNRLAEATSFLENLSIKETMEKDAFFKKLPSLLPSVPTLVAQRKLLPMLANAIEFGGAPPIALTTLLEIGKTLPEEDYSKQVVPILTKLFASSDRGIRRGLLENIATYGPALPDKVVEEQIYNHVASGFTDGNPYLRELTLKSMAVLGPKLSQRTLSQSLLKHLAKLQVDEEASIRANTTVLLGNLAGNLAEATCKKVLLNAFTRALRDGFPPARVAGLKAIVATAKYHSAEDAALRVLPAVAPLCVDAVHEVRASALDCVQHFAAQLAQHHKELERKAAELQEGQAAGAAHDAAAGAPGSSSGGSLLNSFGWAVSNLGLGRSSAADVGGKTPAAAAAAVGSQAPVPDVAPSGRLPAAPAPRAAPAVAADAGSNGWGNDGDFDDAAGLDAEREARQRLSKMGMGGSRAAAASRPAASKPAAAATPPPANEGWGDDAGWADLEVPAPAAARPIRSAGGAAPTPRRPAAARTTSGGAAGSNLRRPAGSSGGAPTRKAGTMKLGVSKLGDKADDFSEW